MAARGSLLLLALLLLSCALPRAGGQHWSHGWYPGGKRDLRTPSDLQVPSPLGRCRPLPCPPRREQPLPVSRSPPELHFPSCPAPRPPRGAAHRGDVTPRAARSLRRRHAAGAEALPPGARPAPGAGGRAGARPLPGALPRLGPAGGAGAGPQDPARPPRQVQGGPGEAAAARGPRGAAGGAGAVPAAPAGAQRPPGGVQGRGAAEEEGGAPGCRGLCGGAGGAPAADGLERGGERPAEGPQRGETQERRGGAEEEEVRDCRETGQENGGFPGGEGEGGSPAAGGSQKLHHPREPGGSDRGVPGQPPELQLRHRQGRAHRQAHGALLAALAEPPRAPQNTHRAFLGMYQLASQVVEKGSGCAASKGLMPAGKGVRGNLEAPAAWLSPVAVAVIPPPTCLDPSHTACGEEQSTPEAEPGSAPRCQLLWMLPKAKEG